VKKYKILFVAMILTICTISLLISSCAVTQKVKDKTGTQLWGENCGRCHNAPGPGEFNAVHWDVVGTHMRVRTNITATEETKIIEYLKNTGN